MKELKITPPEGYEIDKDKSTFENIVFKELKKGLPKSWYDLEKITGYYVSDKAEIDSTSICDCLNVHKNIFKTEEQAEASIALAQLSQLRDVYRDGWIPDWTGGMDKYCIVFFDSRIKKDKFTFYNHFLSFQDIKTRDLFLENFIDLIEKVKPLMS